MGQNQPEGNRQLHSRDLRFSDLETNSGPHPDQHVMTFRSNKRKAVASTPFSDFIRNASSGRKKHVYKNVLETATESQKRVMRATEQRRTRVCSADAD